jgi:hypothetical protein
VGHSTIWATSDGCPYCRLADIAGLVEKWRGYKVKLLSPNYAEGLENCADELQAKLKGGGDRYRAGIFSGKMASFPEKFPIRYP